MTIERLTLTGHEDCRHVLTAITESGQARPGVTLVAHIDRTTSEILGVRSFPTPIPSRPGGSWWEDSYEALSRKLCEVAQQLVPFQDRSTPIRGELVTVVCREGDAVIEETEKQFLDGWWFSNHCTAALYGGVYVVTPTGWAGICRGPEPRLASPGNTDEVELLPDAEPLPVHDLPAEPREDHQPAPGVGGEIVATETPPDPHPGECLLCYVHRMLQDSGCTGLRFATHYRDVRVPRATALESRLRSMGGFCDCEIFLNAYELRPEHGRAGGQDDQELLWPGDLVCAGVQTRSTQPCTLWRRLG